MENIVATTLRTPKSMHAQLKQAASKRGHTLNGLIRQILWDWINDNTPEQDQDSA